MLRAVVVGVALGGLVIAGRASGQPGQAGQAGPGSDTATSGSDTAPAPTTFDGHLSKARELHAKGDFDGARAEILAAYQLDPKPELLFALGQLEFNLHHYQAAIDYYEKFTQAKPSADQVAIAEQAIGAARAELSRQQSPLPLQSPGGAGSAASSQPQPLPPAAAQPLHTQWDGVDTAIVLGGGVAILGGAALLVEAVHLPHDGAGTLSDYDHRVLVAKRLRIGAAIAGGAGLVAIGASLIRWRVHIVGATVEVQASPTGAGVSLEAPL